MGSLMHVARSGIVTGRSGTAIAQFLAIIDALNKSAETLALPELIEEVLDKSRLKDHYAAERDGQDRLENLHELINAAALSAERTRALDRRNRPSLIYETYISGSCNRSDKEKWNGKRRCRGQPGGKAS